MPQPPENTEPAAGQFEVPQDRFDELTEGAAQAALHTIDLKALLPDLFVNTDRMPKRLSALWRQACDEMMSLDRGAYTYRGRNCVELFFTQLPETLARSRVAAISRKIAELAAPGQAAKPSPAHRRATAALQEAQQMKPDLVRLVEEGLSDNPTIILMRLWAARVMHDMIHTPQKVPLLPDMLKLVAGADISYLPLWDAETRTIAGSVAQIKTTLSPENYNTGETARQDLALLFAAVVQIYYLRSKKQDGTLTVPLRAGTLADAAIADLYHSFLLRLEAEAGTRLILSVRDVPTGNVPPAIADAIRHLSNGARSFVFSTAPDNYTNYKNAFPVLHGQEWDAGPPIDAPGSKSELIRKYAKHCKRFDLKAGLRGVLDLETLSAARRAGYTYISGPLLRPAQQQAFAQQAYDLPL